jgi:hypothetical protein
MKLWEAQALEPKSLKEALLKKFAAKTPGQFYGAQEMLEILWPAVEASSDDVKRELEKKVP